MRSVVPLRQRPVDWVLLGFFGLNLLVITYMIDLEQIVIRNVHHFSYPVWPPAPVIDLVHWYGNHYDPALMARPPWWQATIWIDVLLFGPFYAAAVYALIRGREWIRMPAMLWAGMMFANVTIILFEELTGPLRTPHPGPVLAANLTWYLMPLVTIWRLGLREHPLTRVQPVDPERRPATELSA